MPGLLSLSLWLSFISELPLEVKNNIKGMSSPVFQGYLAVGERRLDTCPAFASHSLSRNRTCQSLSFQSVSPDPKSDLLLALRKASRWESSQLRRFTTSQGLIL